jgi:hypothetical protein
LAALRHHVSGAVERGEKESIVEVTDATEMLRYGDLSGVQKCLTKFVGMGGVTVTTVHAEFGKITNEEYEAGAMAVRVTATSDGGRYAQGEWHREEHDGAFSDETVYVETYDRVGRTFHGYIDKVSRKIVQTG